MGWVSVSGAFVIGLLIGAFGLLPATFWILWTYGTTSASLVKQAANSTNTPNSEDSFLEDGEGEGPGFFRADALPDTLKGRRHEPAVASGYFAVCREYVPGGINGKPPERTTPTGDVVPMQSPSVYQTMYRSIFDRNKTASPTIEGSPNRNRRSRNVFYVVLRLGHLMLYDDAEQLEVRHVVSLAHYNVDIYAGGEPIPEGELFIKRNCIRLTQRSSVNGPASKPFCLFSENCSEKEDFYHAMLQSQEYRAGNSEAPAIPLKFNTTDLIRLVQQLHATEENLHTRWINALIGRIFLAMYKTEDVERFIWTKITKKIARVPKPALIDGIHIRSINMGDLPPFITNPKLRDLNVDGDMTIEADVSYKGNFRLEISAIARIDLGTRFKAREVTLILATILKRLDGHVLLRIKPPPSNRVWVTFETAPKMELSIEPIVSTRQITYGVILRAIESRIREVVVETLVLPNWDDIPFSSTSSPSLRGGLWEQQAANEHALDSAVISPEDAVLGDSMTTKTAGLEKETEGTNLTDATPAVSGFKHRASHSSQRSDTDLDGEGGAVSSALDYGKPKAMRAGSFASAANPIVSADPVLVAADERKVPSDAALSMQTTISKTPPLSPETKATSVTPPHSIRRDKDGSHEDMLATSAGISSPDQVSIASSPAFASSPSASSLNLEQGSRQRVNSNVSTFSERRAVLNQSLSSATAAAKKWINARQASNAPTSLEGLDNSNQSSRAALHPSPIPDGTSTPTDRVASDKTPTHANKMDLRNGPMGRGQPLPPPGTPLPLPKPEKRNTWATSTLVNLTRRRPVPGSDLAIPKPTNSPPKPLSTSSSRDIHNAGSERDRSMREPARNSSSNLTLKQLTTPADTLEPGPPPLPKRRQRLSVTEQPRGDKGQEEILVVAAPAQDATSVPPTPNALDPSAQEAEKFWGSLLEKDGTIQAAHVEEGAS